MAENNEYNELFCDYYKKWVDLYKKGAVREVTLNKYRMTHNWLKKLIPDLKVSDVDRVEYQKLLNTYAESHEKQTTMDFHHQLKSSILDAVDEGLILRDPTRKAIIKGKFPKSKKNKVFESISTSNFIIKFGVQRRSILGLFYSFNC